MSVSRLFAKTMVALGAVAVPLGIALAGAGQASADPDVCVGGPFGYAYACVNTPGWAGWYDGPNWYDNGWRGHDHGHGHDH